MSVAPVMYGGTTRRKVMERPATSGFLLPAGQQATGRILLAGLRTTGQRPLAGQQATGRILLAGLQTTGEKLIAGQQATGGFRRSDL